MSQRFSIAFWLLFAAIAGVIALRYAGVAIPAEIIFILALAGGLLGVVCFFRNMQSAHKALNTSAHPDEDVAALINGQIDIQEYRVRNENRGA